MKLKHIQLHPFGGVADRSFTFHDGLNVIEGPNEFGKSTLNNALWHTLFTNSKLTPSKLKKVMGRWLPKPNGDHVSVSLEFEADGKSWTLNKSWGARAESSLKESGGQSIVDPNSVQDKLFELLQRNEATWQHVLFVNQAELTRTVHALQENANQIENIQPFVLGAASIPGDISADDLQDAIDEKISDHYGRWEIDSDGPQRGRGIGNPWSVGVGPLLSAYYGQETVRAEFHKVIAHEKQVDSLNSQIRQVQAQLEENREFVETGQDLRNGLAQRGSLEEKEKGFERELKSLKKVMMDWPGAAKIIESKESEYNDVSKSLKNIERELEIAEQLKAAENFKNEYKRILDSKEQLKAASERLSKLNSIPTDLLSELKTLEHKIKELQINLKAQKLNASIESQQPKKVTITRGANAAEDISLNVGENWSATADGKVSFEFDDLSIRVESGNSDVNQLLDDIEAAKNRQQEILHTLKVEDINAAVAADQLYKEAFAEEHRLKGLYQAALRDRSEEEWKSKISELAALPQTRSIEVLKNERGAAFQKNARLEAEIQQEKVNIQKWTEEYKSPDSLTEKIIETTAEQKETLSKLEKLPSLPEGFNSVPEYFDKLDKKATIQRQMNDRLGGLNIELAELSGGSPEKTAEDLKEELDLHERTFQKRVNEGLALQRIKAKLETIVANRDEADPLANLESSIAEYFSKLTSNRYQNIRLDGTAPVEVIGQHSLETSLLSEGTAGSLALATRLAMAELYLDEMDGFLILDDPFTDMDPDRREAAHGCLGKFSENHQVILFTCHPEHAEELLKLTNASRPQMDDETLQEKAPTETPDVDTGRLF
ncbi:MAG: AAA family ATPase [Planctomycetaceae bacterium]|nr:AAA family ATPase [Planctomycetaceae bacterium]